MFWFLGGFNTLFYRRPWHISTQLTFTGIFYDYMIYEDYDLVWLRKRVQGAV